MTERFVILSQQELTEIIHRTASAVAEDLRRDLQNSKTREIMSKSELADHWRCSPATINRYMNAGMPFEKIDGGHPTFTKTSVNNWRERFQKIQRKENNRQRQELV
jgi:hypothetical protein